jgi:hypothetical protein
VTYIAAFLAGASFGLIYLLIFTVTLGIPNPRGTKERIKNLRWLIGSMSGLGGAGSGLLYWLNGDLLPIFWIGQGVIFLLPGVYVGIKYIIRA